MPMTEEVLSRALANALRNDVGTETEQALVAFSRAMAQQLMAQFKGQYDSMIYKHGTPPA